MTVHWKRAIVSSLALAVVFMGTSAAQQPQIPTLQVCNPTVVSGGGVMELSERQAPGVSGRVTFQIEIGCDPQVSPFPAGDVLLRVDMTDSIIAEIRAISLEQVTTTGKHTPTAYFNGRCEAEGIPGCRFWMTAADNSEDLSGTPDVLGFLVFDGEGQRMAYGTGPIIDGDIHVEATSF